MKETSLISSNSAKIQSNEMDLTFPALCPGARYYEDANKKVIILGSPIYNGKIDCYGVIEKLKDEPIENFITDVNGSFLFFLYEKEAARLTAVNDRFASIPFYYRDCNGIFAGSTSYSEIWKKHRNTAGFKIDEGAFYEFLFLRRLFGDKTYDCDTKFLDSASILIHSPDSKKTTVTRYWQPDCVIHNMPFPEAAERLAFLIQQSFKRVTSDAKRYGLLLSGGLDSRSVLAASDKPLVCLTTCEYENNEYLVARELANVRGYEHIFVPKPKTYYSDIIDSATDLGSGMGIYANAHFFNMRDAAAKTADVLLHGYGFDFLFGGKYLPCTAHPLLKGITYKRRLLPIEPNTQDAARMFIETLSYRLKSIDPRTLIKVKQRTGMVDALQKRTEDIFDEAREISDNPYAWWDYSLFRNMSRHYSYLNLLSIRTYLEERTVAFDNDLYDFFWSLSPEQRLNGVLFKEAIRSLDPEIFRVRLANTNLSLGDPDIVASGKILLNQIFKVTRLNRIFKRSIPPPRAKERSWSIDADTIRDNLKLKERTQRLCASSNLERLRFLDIDAVSACVKEHIEGRKDHTYLILSLITLDKFLE
ncbi:asparagine synthase-related protein [Omnitrophica bacterium]|nr:asparagine synthase-related protein [Candidatus Omnitrophota bacterium]